MDAAATPLRGMRLVFVNRYFHPDVSATSQMLTDLTCHLARAGAEIHVVCSAQLYDNPRSRLPSDDVVDWVRVHRVTTTGFGRDGLIGRALDYLSFYASALRRLSKLLVPGDILIVKTDPPLMSIPAAWLAGRHGVTLINWLQDIYPEVADRLGALRLPAALSQLLLRRRNHSLNAAARNVVLGERMRRHLLDCGVPDARIRIIENWADASRVVPMEPAESNLRRRLHLMTKFVVGYSGNLGRAHEIETLLGAAEQLRARRDIVFLMTGSGALMNNLQREVSTRSLRQFVFLPYQTREQLSDTLAAADVHLACLRPQLEGLIVPSKFYGVLAAARPVLFVGDLQGELARIVRAERCGVTIPTGNATALRNAIEQLQLQHEWRWAMGRRARELLTERYTLDVAAEQWIDMLIACQTLPLPERAPQPAVVAETAGRRERVAA